MTADVDVTADVAPSRIQELLRVARRLGMVPREAEVERIALESRVVPLEFGSPAIPLDIVLSGPGLEEAFHERAHLVRIGKAEIPVISPEDLVITKLIAGRPRDKEDVRGILAERGEELDGVYLRNTLALVESALDRSDLLPLLEDLGGFED